jgi:hypothetical protein
MPPQRLEEETHWPVYVSVIKNNCGFSFWPMLCRRVYLIYEHIVVSCQQNVYPRDAVGIQDF